MRFLFSLILLSILIFSLSCKTTTQDQSSRSSSEIQQEELQEKPQSIVIPVSTLGDVSETRQQILQNSLEDELKEHFTLISQERFEEAQEKAFEQLEYEECTEDQCIMLIQEMLQVENVFHLQVIGEGSNTQLSLSWRTLDVNRKETDTCLDCDTFDLDKKIQGIVGNLIGSSKKVNFTNKNVSQVLRNSNILSAVKHIHAKDNDYIQIILEIIKYETNSLNFKGVEFEIELHGYKKYGFADIRMINVTFDNTYFKSFDIISVRECLLGKNWLIKNQGSNIYKFSLNLEKINVHQGKCVLESLKINESNIISEILSNMVLIVNSSISGENLNDYYSNTHRPKDNYWKDYGVNSENDFWLSISKTIEEKSEELYLKNDDINISEKTLIDNPNRGGGECEKVCEGLVGFYPFNGNANDMSGNGNHGEVFGAQLTFNHKGEKDSAYLFDGESSYIEIQNIVNNSSFSFSAYVKAKRFIEESKKDCPENGGSRAGIITFGFSGLQLMNCSGWGKQTGFPDNVYKLWFQIHSFCGAGKNCVMESNWDPNNGIQLKKYYLYTVTYNKDTQLVSLYQNNKLIDKKRWNFTIQNKLNIGIWNKDNLLKPGALSGTIDEIRIYNRVLQRNEINQIISSVQ